MPAPRLSLTLSGSAPKVAAVGDLEAQVNDGFQRLWDQTYDGGEEFARLAEAAAASMTSVMDFVPVAAEPIWSSSRMKFVTDAGQWLAIAVILMVVGGQSNRVRYSIAPGAGESQGNVFYRDGVTWVVATPAMVGDITYIEAHRVSVAEGRPVFIVHGAVAGTSIARWVPGGDLFDALSIKAANAVTDLAARGYKIHRRVFDFSQGEGEYALAPLYSLSTFRYPALVDGVRAASWGGPQCKIIFTELLRQSKEGTTDRVNREWQRLVSAGYTGVHLAPSDGLATEDPTDGSVQVVHFDPPGRIEMGLRCANIQLGLSQGVTSGDVAGRVTATGERIWKERAYTFTRVVNVGPGNVNPQVLNELMAITGTPVLWEVNGVTTEILSGPTASVFTYTGASDATVTIWVPTDANYDQATGFSAVATPGEGAIRSIVLNPLAHSKSVYISGHSGLMHNVDPSTWGKRMETFRLDAAPLVVFDSFVAAEMPKSLTTLSFTSTTPVPQAVRDAIAAENAKRGNTIDVTYGTAYLPANAPAAEKIPSVFGIIGNNTIDDWARLMDALSCGKPVKFRRDHTHKILSPLVVPNNAIIEGELKLVYGGAGAVSCLTIGNDVMLEDLDIDTGSVAGPTATIGTGYKGGSFKASGALNNGSGFLSIPNPAGLDLDLFEMLSGCQRPLTLGTSGDTPAWTFGGRLGRVKIKNALRGIGMNYLDGFELGGYDITGKNVLAGKTPGHNAILAAGLRNCRFGPGKMEGAGEHLWRIGGTAAMGASYNNSFGDMDLDNPGGSFFKLNADAVAYDLRFGDINAIGRFATAPGGNSELLRMSHGRNISFGAVRLMLGNGAAYSAQDALAMNDIQGLSIAHLHVENIVQSVIDCDSTQDVGTGLGAGAVRNVHIGGLTGSDANSAALIRLAMGAGFPISDITIAGMDYFSDGSLITRSATTVIDGICSVSGRLRKTDLTTVPATTLLPAPSLFAVSLALGDKQMINGPSALEIGGVPLYSKGSNANGSWVRWGDWQVCTMTLVLDLSITTQQTFTFPQSFLASPGVSISLGGLSGVDDNYKAVARVGLGASTNSVRLRPDTAVAGVTAVTVTVQASGPWR